YYPPITNISHTILPSQPQTYHTVIMVKIVPCEGFACPCGTEDVVLRESYKPKTRGSLTHPRYSPGASTPQSYSLRTSKNSECSNGMHLLDKITVLEEMVDMYMHPEQL
nr:hypothetical protein [Tanacetum cinerariifolium]